ncbi:MAG TPA: sigma-70 family RNA polymerase sigma factor [Planctomycetota bacterium]
MIDRDSLIRSFQADRFRLIAYIRALVGDPELTEEIFQEVSVVVLQKIEAFDPSKDLQAWCRGIARNLVLRERERSRRLRIFDSDQIIDLVDAAFEEKARVDDTVDAQRSLLRRCMGHLADSSREILDLRYRNGLSLRAIAGKMERTEGAVQVALSRVRKWLAECVQRRGQAATP